MELMTYKNTLDNGTVVHGAEHDAKSLTAHEVRGLVSHWRKPGVTKERTYEPDVFFETAGGTSLWLQAKDVCRGGFEYDGTARFDVSTYVRHFSEPGDGFLGVSIHIREREV